MPTLRTPTKTTTITKVPLCLVAHHRHHHTLYTPHTLIIFSLAYLTILYPTLSPHPHSYLDIPSFSFLYISTLFSVYTMSLLSPPFGRPLREILTLNCHHPHIKFAYLMPIDIWTKPSTTPCSNSAHLGSQYACCSFASFSAPYSIIAKKFSCDNFQVALDE